MNPLTQYLAIGAAAVVAVLLILLGVEYFEIESLKKEATALIEKNAACQASNVQLEQSLGKQNKAVADAVAAGKREVAAAIAAGVAAAKAGQSAAKADYDRALAEQARKKPAGADLAALCNAARNDNAAWLGSRP